MMDVEQFEVAVRTERLGRWIRRGRPAGVSANEVCVFPEDDRWVTVMTDERAAVVETTYREFDAESKALEDALDGARLLRSFAGEHHGGGER